MDQPCEGPTPGMAGVVFKYDFSTTGAVVLCVPCCSRLVRAEIKGVCTPAVMVHLLMHSFAMLSLSEKGCCHTCALAAARPPCLHVLLCAAVPAARVGRHPQDVDCADQRGAVQGGGSAQPSGIGRWVFLVQWEGREGVTGCPGACSGRGGGATLG
jgi:hypothetical protein